MLIFNMGRHYICHYFTPSDSNSNRVFTVILCIQLYLDRGYFWVLFQLPSAIIYKNLDIASFSHSILGVKMNEVHMYNENGTICIFIIFIVLI